MGKSKRFSIFFAIFTVCIYRRDVFAEFAVKEATLDELSNTTSDGTSNSASKNETDATGRLPTSLRPTTYHILLQPFINGNRSIYGEVEIEFNVYRPTNRIVINMADIVTFNDTCKVKSVAGGHSSENPMVVKQSYNPSLQFYTVELDRDLVKGQKYWFSVSFMGYLNSKLVGFYLSSYKDSSGKEHRLAATQFSPVDARRAFPCFDEPFFKAVFNIALRRRANYTSMSNMQIKNTFQVKGQPGWYEDRFDPSLRQSTYIVGFLISDFEGIVSDQLNHTQFAVWSRADALSQADYSLNIGPKLLLFLENYFGIQYPLPKLDMAAIPDFKFRGMENWGLIMYRESAMLFDPSVSTISSKRGIARVVAHELAHMWFGNLVTPHWWSDLWLKEGFANYMGYTALDEVEPGWKMLESLVTSSTQSALAFDSLRSTHPVQVAVDKVDRISEIFDSISYNKGASIIRMMFHYLTEGTFKKGMKDYVAKLQYSNAFQDDLWGFLTDAWKQSLFYPINSTLNVKEIMDTWTLQDGYPLISVVRNGTDLVFTQERFLLEGNRNLENFSTATVDSKDESVASGWWVPISLASASSGFEQTQPDHWMMPSDETITLTGGLDSQTEWIIANVQRSGFYRVNYELENWNLIKGQIFANHSVVHALNRAQLLDDSWTLASAGMLNYSVPVELSFYLRHEREYTPWVTFISVFNYVFKMAKTTINVEPFKKYLLYLLIPIYEEIGFDDRIDDSYETQSLRILIIKYACLADHKPCLDAANELYSQWLEDPHNASAVNISNNVKPTVLCSGISTGSELSWNKTFQAYLDSNVQTEKNDILGALGCTKNKRILERYLTMSLYANSGIIKQDIAAVFQATSTSAQGRDLAWELVKQKWDFILEHFGSGSSAIWRILGASTSSVNTESQVKEMQEFEKTKEGKLGSARQTMAQALEDAILNTAFMEQIFQKLLSQIQGHTTTSF